MSDLAEKLVESIQREQSRRGFLAMCGKAMLLLGGAMAGIRLEPRPAYAGCCVGPTCDSVGYGCPAGPGCPPPCGPGGVPNLCCDRGGTGTTHQCWQCTCGGALCVCEYDLGTRC
jgi:hypothetical protein